MCSKVFILVVTVFAVVVYAEPPLQNNQNQEIPQPYQSSGWRPSGPVFRIPERPPLPITFYSSPPQNQVDLTYGPPQEKPLPSEVDKQEEKNLDKQRNNFERQVAYNIPQERNINQFQRENYISRTSVKLNQPNLSHAISKTNQKEEKVEIEDRVELPNNVPQETLSVPPEQPVVTYGPPTVESSTGLPSGARRSGKEFKDHVGTEQQDNPHEQVDANRDLPQEKFGCGDNQDQEDLKYHALRPNVPFNQPKVDGQINGIEYHVDLTYGAPQETLAVPPNQPAVTYGPPEEETISTTTELESTTTELPTTTESATEESVENTKENTEPQEENVVKKENLKVDDEETSGEQNQYYIYHPSGVLQKVIYSAKDDQTNMAYSARLKYETVEPIRGPVYTYDPETFVFSRLY